MDRRINTYLCICTYTHLSRYIYIYIFIYMFVFVFLFISLSLYIGGWGEGPYLEIVSFRSCVACATRRDATRDHCTLVCLVPRTASSPSSSLLRACALGFVSDLARIWLAVLSLFELLAFSCFAEFSIDRSFAESFAESFATSSAKSFA